MGYYGTLITLPRHTFVSSFSRFQNVSAALRGRLFGQAQRRGIWQLRPDGVGQNELRKKLV